MLREGIFLDRMNRIDGIGSILLCCRETDGGDTSQRRKDAKKGPKSGVYPVMLSKKGYGGELMNQGAWVGSVVAVDGARGLHRATSAAADLILFAKMDAWRFR